MNLRIRRMLRSAAIALAAFCPLAANAAPAAYIANSGDNTVSVVDLSSFTVTNTIAVGAGPQSVAIHPSRPRVYVSNYTDGTVSVIDTQLNTVVDTISLTALSIHPWSAIKADVKVAQLLQTGGHSVDGVLLRHLQTAPRFVALPSARTVRTCC